MKKWYRTSLMKGILAALAAIATVVVTVSLLWLVQFLPSGDMLVPYHLEKKYEDSGSFEDQLQSDVSAAMDNEDVKVGLEQNGKYDGSKLVDVEVFYNKHKITGKNGSGVAYTVDQLYQWGKDGVRMGYDLQGTHQEMTDLVVCRTPEGTFKYFQKDELKKEIQEGKLVISGSGQSDGTASIDDRLMNSDGAAITDQENRVVYSEFWIYDADRLVEKFAPDGAKSLVDIANGNNEWNGRLEDLTAMVSSTISSVYQQVSDYRYSTNEYKEGNTNFRFLYANLDQQKVYSNVNAYKDTAKIKENVDNFKKLGKYILVYPERKDFDSNLKNVSAAEWQNAADKLVPGGEEPPENYILAVGVDTAYPINDNYYSAKESYEVYVNYASVCITALSVSLAVFLISIIWLIAVCGRRPEDDGVHLNFFDRWKPEIAAVLLILAGSGCAAVAAEFFSYRYGTGGNFNPGAAGMIAAFMMLGFLAFLIGILSLARRLKAHTLWQNSLLRMLVTLFGRITRNIGTLWKTLAVGLAVLIIHWIAMGVGPYNGGWIFLAVLTEFAVLVYIVYTVLGRREINKGIQHIAEGNMEYKIPLKHLRGEQKEIADKVNHIGDGLEKAVERSMKSERMKTDLITNVSHDIKTPLTSIINYVGLLKQENFEDPQVRKYIDILDDKSQRLKKLTEDVVEASKVSSGNITLERADINFGELLQQASGEFEERLSERHLTEIVSVPDEPAVINVDPQKTWRILENLYNNMAKYAMEGTRIYTDLRIIRGSAQLTVKNISEEPLNITPDELTERFIRGDAARTKEGSGLGLSIARSLTELQGGSFELQLDGDLFKTILRFPISRKAAAPGRTE